MVVVALVVVVVVVVVVARLANGAWVRAKMCPSEPAVKSSVGIET